MENKMNDELFYSFILSKLVVILPGVLAFFVLLGFFGLILHCSALNSNDPRMAGCHNCCYGWGILDCFPASVEACFALFIVFVVIFAILGIAYGFLAATMAIQRIWQRHYHILTKRELTKVSTNSHFVWQVLREMSGKERNRITTFSLEYSEESEENIFAFFIWLVS